MKRKKEKTAIVKILILMTLLICLTGCGRHEGAGTEAPGSAEESVSEEPPEEAGIQEEVIEQEENNIVKEIPVDFSFWSSALREEVDYFSLTLAQLKEPAGEYELRLYNQKGNILQQVSCGVLTEPIEITFGDFDQYSGPPVNDMEIFSSDASEGLYIGWDDVKLRFYEAIKVPKYTEIQAGKMLVEEDGDVYQVKKVYELGSYEIRRLLLNKDTGELEIWDCLDDVSLFNGIAKLDKEGNLINEEYYDMLLWEDTYSVYDDGKSLYTWTMISWERTEDGEWGIGYESREEMLESLGFAGSEPVYQYYDWHHNLRVELYMDEAMEHGCGIDYEYSYDRNMEKRTKACGFVIENVDQKEEWAERDFYSEISLLGPEHADDKFEEIIEYTSDGKPDYYRAQGLVAFNSAEGPVPTVLLELEYVYRDDGSLCYRYFLPYQRLWGSIGSTYSFFDEKERLVYEEEHVSYEPVRHYYIYQGEKDKPAYHLEVGYHLDDARLYPVK